MISADEEDVLNIIPATSLKQEKHKKLKQKHSTNTNTLAVVGLNGYIYRIPSSFVTFTQTKPTISYSRQKVAEICVKPPPGSSHGETTRDVTPSSLSNHDYKVDFENDNSQSGIVELKEDENGIKKRRKKSHEKVRKPSPKKKKKKRKIKVRKVRNAAKVKHGKKKAGKKSKEVTKKKKKRKHNRSKEFSSLEEEEPALKLKKVSESVDGKERKKKHKKDRSRSPSSSVELKKRKCTEAEDIYVSDIFANGHAYTSDHPPSLSGVDTDTKILSKSSFVFESENISNSVNDIERKFTMLDHYRSDESEVGSNGFSRTVLDSSVKDAVLTSPKSLEDQCASSPEKYDPFQCADVDIFYDDTQSEESSNLSEIYNTNDSSSSVLYFTKNEVKDNDVISNLASTQIAKGILSCNSYGCDKSVTNINHEIDREDSAPTRITIETQNHLSKLSDGTLLDNRPEDKTLSNKAEDEVGLSDENLGEDNSYFKELNVDALQSNCLTSDSPRTSMRLVESSSPPTLPPPSEIPLPEQSVNEHEPIELCAIPVPQVPKDDLEKNLHPLLPKTQRSRADLNSTELYNIKLPFTGKKETRISHEMPSSDSLSAELYISESLKSCSDVSLTVSNPIKMNIQPAKEPVRIKFALKTLPSRISKLIKYQEEEEDAQDSKSEENNSATADNGKLSFDEEPANSASANDHDFICDEVSANVHILDEQNTCENLLSTLESIDKLEEPSSHSSFLGPKEDKEDQLDESTKNIQFQNSTANITAKPLDESTDPSHRMTLSRSRSPRKISRSRSPYRKQRSMSPRSKRSWSPRKKSISRSPLRRSHSRSPTKRLPLRISPNRRAHSPKRYRHTSPKNRRRSSPRKGSSSTYHNRSSSPKRHRSPGRRSPQRRTHKRLSPQRASIRELSPRKSPIEKDFRRSPYVERAASPKTKRWSPKRVFKPVSPIVSPHSPAQLYRNPSPVLSYHPVPVLKEVPIEDRAPELNNLQASAIETITSIERQEVIPRPRKEAIHSTVLITIEPQAIPLPEPTSPAVAHSEEMEISSVSSEEIEPERRMSLDERLKVELGVGEEEPAPSVPLGGGGWNFNEPKQFSQEGSELIRHYMEELEKYYATLRNYGGYAEYPPPVTLVRVDNTLRIIPTMPVNLSSQTTHVPTKPALVNCRITGNTSQAKRVVFADNVRPGEGTSPSCGEDMPSPSPPMRKRKRRKKKTPSPPDDNIDDLKAELASPPPPPPLMDLPFSQFVKTPLPTSKYFSFHL
ncbi:hypothetical protein QYM36_002710 [Artemia franciscana]|uniref:Uncharacterized protein n=1 Tax=Artemia franciscana TaxID=6661 RepID=A0AA88II59_ARTSF|nr:hypothetical protein QYM36_002710 [Artemia franciscana]